MNIRAMYFLLPSLLPISVASAGTVFDAAADFSATNNPNGVWSYGQSAALTSPFQVYTNHGPDNVDPLPGVEAWFGTPVYSVPAVLFNPTASTVVFGNITVQPGQLFFHPGQADQYSDVRFTAPRNGSYSLSAAFSPVDSKATTDVHILVNNKPLWNSLVNPGPTSFDATLTLTAGEVVDLKVGFGADGNFFDDSTGLDARLVETNAVPEPSSLTLAGLGFLVMVCGMICGRRTIFALPA